MRAATLLSLASLFVLPSFARADGRGDGVYGRFDDSVTLAFTAGGGATHVGDTWAPTAQAEVRLRILGSAGPFVSGAYAGTLSGRLVAGIEMRPLFPGLFLIDRSTGHEWLDLFLGGIGVEVGAGFAFDEGHVQTGLAWGVAIELPLVYPSRFAQGIALRLAARHFRAERRIAGMPNRGEPEWSMTASLVVGIGLGSATARWEPSRY